MIESYNDAKFGRGLYWIKGGFSPSEHFIMSSHEEIHGITHRSTAYGTFLRYLRSYLPKSDPNYNPMILHYLTSRSRTSDEVMATFGSIVKANSGDQTKKAVPVILQAHPAYKIYYNIGMELVGTDENQISHLVLDAIIRFCWSSSKLPSCHQMSEDISSIKNLPNEVFPDYRLGIIRNSWSKSKLLELSNNITGSEKEFLVSISDKIAYMFQAPEGYLFITNPGFESQQNTSLLRLAGLQAKMEEILTIRLYESVVEMFSNTAISGMPHDELMSYIDENKSKERTGVDFPEILDLKSTKTKVVRVDQFSYYYKGILFALRREDFLNHFTLDKEDEPRLGDCVCFRTSMDYIPQDIGKEIIMKLYDTKNLNPKNSITSLIQRNDFLVLKASDFIRWRGFVEELFRKDLLFWLICDINPSDLIRQTRSIIPELQANWTQPIKALPEVGAMVACQIGNGGDLDGIVFPGSRITCNSIIASVLIKELGDSLRSINSIGPIGEILLARKKQGLFVTKYITTTFRYFSYHTGGEK